MRLAWQRLLGTYYSDKSCYTAQSGGTNWLCMPPDTSNASPVMLPAFSEGETPRPGRCFPGWTLSPRG